MNIFNLILIQPLANGLILFYRLLGSNMGLAIIGFSLTLRLLITPLTKPYMESMKKMREFAPDIDKIKKKYKDDKQKQMQAQSDFYKQKGINPGAGCLPYLIQIVILIALFNVFNRALAGHGVVTDAFNDLLYAPLKFLKGDSLNTSFLYLNIAKPDVFKVAFLPFTLPGPILILAALSQMISAKMSSPYIEAEEKVAEKTKEKSDDMAVAMQNSAIYTFPLITILAGVNFPSGLAIYWLLFSIYQTIQQYMATGWGGATPWLKRLGLLQSVVAKNGKTSKRNHK